MLNNFCRWCHLGSLRYVPVVWRYWRNQGGVATFNRIREVLNFGLSHNINVANQWLQDYKDNLDAEILNAACFNRSCVSIIGAQDLPQCKKYRVSQKIEQLAYYGIDVKISNYFDVPKSFNIMQLSTSVIFYRIPDGDLFRGYLNEARRLRIPVGYDIDDPIISRDIYSKNSNLDTLSKEERRSLLAQIPIYLFAMKACDFCIASTPGMANVIKELFARKVYLWRNALDRESETIVTEIFENSEFDTEKLEEAFVMGYMSGSRAHDKDFMIIATVLEEILKKFSKVKLLLGGYVSLPESLRRYESQIILFPFSNYQQYFKTLSMVDAVLIPLLIDEFNECKSAIRYLEAAALGKPCIVSKTGDFKNIVQHGVDGLLAETKEDWYESIVSLIKSPHFREKLSKNARSCVFEKYTSEAIVKGLDRELFEVLGRKSG